MKIFVMTTGLRELGGAEYTLVATLKNWPNDRDKFFVLVLSRDIGFVKEFEEIKDRITIINLNFHSPWYYPKIFMKAFRCIKKFDKKIEPDIIFVQMSHLGILAVLAMSHRKQVVRLNSGYIFPSGKNFGGAGELGFTSKIRYKLFWLILKKFPPSKYVAISEFVKKSALVSLGAKSKDIEVVHNGIEIINRKKDNHGKKNLPFCTVGRFIPSKGHLDLIKAFKLATRGVQDIKLRIVGIGPLKQQYLELIADLGIQNNVSVEDYVRKPYSVYQSSSALIMTSYGEAFGLVVIEAMRESLPVIAWRGSAFEEIIEDGVTGILVPEGDIEALAAAILRLHNDTNLSRNMGIAGFKRVREKFTIERYVKHLQSIFINLIKENHL